MVVNDLDGDGVSLGAVPFEADPPLIVDSDAVLTGAIASQRFKPVPGDHAEHLE